LELSLGVPLSHCYAMLCYHTEALN
jgi:hypothetical protein